MRVLLVALNAKYVQTNLALRYLRETIKAEFPETILKEATINESLGAIAGEIFEYKADIICFSCYIWNITEILKLIRDLRLVLPEVRFVLGGPEVSFETQELMLNNPELDAVVRGEGEAAFLELLRAWKAGRDPDKIPGVVWRCRDKIISNPERMPKGWPTADLLVQRRTWKTGLFMLRPQGAALLIVNIVYLQLNPGCVF